MPKKINMLSRAGLRRLREYPQFVAATDPDDIEKTVREEFEKFIDEAIEKGVTAALEGTEVFLETKRSGIGDVELVVEVTVSVEGTVYNILDGGISKVPRRAEDYGIKAFPMRYPRSEEFGNTPLTQPDSVELQPAVATEDIVFSKEIRTSVPPRNFTQKLADRLTNKFEEDDIPARVRVLDG